MEKRGADNLAVIRAFCEKNKGGACPCCQTDPSSGGAKGQTIGYHLPKL